MKCENCNKRKVKYKCDHCGGLFCQKCYDEFHGECGFCCPTLRRIDQ